MNIKLKAENHYQCVDALALKESYTDSVPIDQVKESIHGCNGVQESHKGSWYQLFKTAEATVDHYKIGGYNRLGESKDIVVETYDTCDSTQCGNRQQGTHLDLQLNIGYKYVFVYSLVPEDIISVGVVLFDKVEHSVCTNPKAITVPYTKVGFIDTTHKTAMKCNMRNMASFWYSIYLTESVDLTVSTISTDTKVDTYVEVLTGCYGDSNSQCIASNDNRESTLDKSSKVSFSAYSVTKYNVGVGQWDANPGAHRISIYPTHKPSESRCSTAKYLNLVEQQTLYVYTEYAYLTKVGANLLKGTYYRFFTDNRHLQITVRTCAVGTQINNLIGIFEGCKTQQIDGEEYSTPETLVAGRNSSNIACGNYGAEITYLAKPQTNYYLYIAALQNGYDGFIEAEVIIEEKNPEDSDIPDDDKKSEGTGNLDEDENGMSGWEIFGMLFYVYAVVVFALATVGILFFKKKNTSSSSFSNF